MGRGGHVRCSSTEVQQVRRHFGCQVEVTGAWYPETNISHSSPRSRCKGSALFQPVCGAGEQGSTRHGRGDVSVVCPGLSCRRTCEPAAPGRAVV